jgi:hypothetical protein
MLLSERRDAGRGAVIGGMRGMLDLLKGSGLPIYFAPSVIHLSSVPPQRKVNRVDMGTADKLCAVALGIRDQSMRPGIDYEATSTRKFFAPAPWPTLRATRRRTQRNRWPAPAPMPVAVLPWRPY